jgi:2'-5' RNA ligase
VPVPAADPVVGAIRSRHTTDGAEGMPAHITLLYPFLDSTELTTEAIASVRRLVARVEPFALTLAHTDRFVREHDVVLWLAPEPSHPFVELTDALTAEFPDHPPYGGRLKDVVPHLTVAIGTAVEADACASIVGPRLPLETFVAEAAIFEHGAEGWRHRTALPLVS